MSFKVIQAIDSLDPNPTVFFTKERHDAEEIAAMWLQEAVDHVVQHSPYSITDEDLEKIYESESQLIQIEEVNQ